MSYPLRPVVAGAESIVMEMVKAFFKKLAGKIPVAVLVGVVQSIAGFVSGYVGLPGAVVFILVTGGAALINLITEIPAAWVWFTAAVALALGMPSTIRASAELRRASADLIRAANEGRGGQGGSPPPPGQPPPPTSGSNGKGPMINARGSKKTLVKKSYFEGPQTHINGEGAEDLRSEENIHAQVGRGKYLSELNNLVQDGRAILVRANEARSRPEFNAIVDKDYEEWARNVHVFLETHLSKIKADRWHGLSPYDLADFGRGDIYENRRLTEISLHVKKLNQILETEDE